MISGKPQQLPAQCPACSHPLAILDRIPILSWLLLRGRCRYCTAHISSIYPLVELLSVVSLVAILLIIPVRYQLAYVLFFSTLLITVFTDARYMLISRYVTVYLLPLPLILSIANLLPITPTGVMWGALSGYGVLAAIAYLFAKIMKKPGMGQGDIDLLCYIGAFLGFGGWWISLLLGSLFGTIIGILYIVFTQQGKDSKIPFGPFLAVSAMIYTLWGQQLLSILFPHLV